MDVINIAADHQMFMTLTGELSWQRLRRWKARGRIYIRYNCTFFAISYTVETLWEEIGWSRRFSKGVDHFERRFQREGGIVHQPLLVSEN